jgi:LPS export ABC transporter protein LptC
MRIATDQLHLDMKQQLATTSAVVRVDWAGNALRGRGMSADIKNDRLQLAGDVHGVLAH